MTPDCACACAGVLRGTWESIAAERGGEPIEITVSTAPPLVMNQFIEAMRCPHGVTFYFEPTGDQIAKWAAEEVQ